MKEYDVIIVGAGLTGSWVAKETSEGGAETLIVDAGAVLSKTLFQNRREKPTAQLGSRICAALNNRPEIFREHFFSKQTWRLFADKKENPYACEKGKPFKWIRGRQVGGRGHMWGRIVLRYTDQQLHASQSDGIGLDWPLSASDLEPYYQKVENLLKVVGPTKVTAGDESLLSPIRLALSPEATRFKKLLEPLQSEIKIYPSRMATYAPGPLSPMLENALKTNKTTLLENKVAARICMSPDGQQAVGIEVIDRATQKREILKARIIVLSASAVESVRLLLNSACERHMTGLGNSSGLLGCYMLDHMKTGVYCWSKNLVTPRHHPIVLDPFDASPFFDYGFYISPFSPETHDFHRCYQMAGFAMPNGLVGLMAFGEMLPRKENRIFIDPSKKDAWGIPTVRFDIEWSENDLRMWKHQKETLTKIWSAVKGKTWIDKMAVRHLLFSCMISKRPVPGGGIHESGGAPMGKDPTQSVVTPYNRLWDVPNVFVTDASVFPSIGYQNTTLTAMALAVRTSEYILKTMKEKKT